MQILVWRKKTFGVLFILLFSALGYLLYFELTTPGYTQWSRWSECSKSCGEGLRGRSRKCMASRPGIFGEGCQGPLNVTEKCFHISHCPIDGGFTEWGSYGACDKTCGAGIRVRIRRCMNPIPGYGGKPCEGKGFEKMNCTNKQPCPVNGGYTAWGAYSKCEITGNQNCGKGKHVRTRTCNNPVPQHGGKACEGPDSEKTECEIPCPTTPPRNTTTTPLNTTSNYSTLATTKAKAS